MLIERFPLQWPAGWRRASIHDRKIGQFNKRELKTSTYTKPDGTRDSYMAKAYLTVADGVKRVLAELGRMGVRDGDIVISTNVQVRLDGLPRSGQKAPDDPGVAVYWLEPGSKAGDIPRCMAIDAYTAVEDNLAAVAATLEALRAIERHGSASILNRALAGLQAALPAPGGLASDNRGWREVLDVDHAEKPDPGLIERNYHRLRSIHHPDRGGTVAQFKAVENAFEEARRLGYV